jgi:organic radical activating enzyme
MNKKPWCMDPFIQMAHTADGFYRVCCIGEVHRERTDLNTKEMTPLEYWNSDVSKQIRNDMLKPVAEFSDVTKFACSQCLKNNRDGVRSRRQTENKRYDSNTKAKVNVIKHIKNIDYTYDDLLYVNFKVLGNICNLKCVMCSANASSKIAAEAKQHYGFPRGWSAGDKAELEPFTPDTRNDYFTELQKIIDSIPKFNLVGGENLIHPDFPRLFQMFIDSPNISNIDMLIITNGTIVPDIVQKNAHLFKSMAILISMDGVFERGSYVRSGLNWKKFDTNVRKFASNPNVFLRLVPAIQMLNVGYVKEMHNWIESVGLDPKEAIDWNNVVTYPETLRAINLPEEIKKQYMRKMIGPDITHPSIRVVFDILKQPQHSHKEFLEGLKYLRKLDKIRNTNLLEHFPEFEKYIGEIDDN